MRARPLFLSFIVLMIIPGFLCLAQAPDATGSALSLADAIALAQAHHPSLDVARANENVATAGVRQARALSRPSVIVAEDATYSDDPVFAFGSKLRQRRFAQSDFTLDSLNHPDALVNSSGSATLNWTAVDITVKHRVASATATQQAATLQRRYTAEELAAKVTSLYYRVLTAEGQVTVAQHALARAKELDASVSDRVHSGLALEADGSRAQLIVRNAEDDLAQSKDNLSLSRADLFAMMGIAPNEKRLLLNADAGADPPAFHEGAARQRLDIQALSAQATAARESQSAAHTALYPQITTYGHVEHDAQHLVTNGSWNWTVGAKVQFSVFDGGVRKAREEDAAARVAAIEAQGRTALLDADTRARQLQTQIDDFRRRMTTAGEAVRVQEETLATARDRYNSGLAPLTDVLNAETDLTSAEVAQLRIAYQLRTTSANLAFATGTPLISKAGKP